MRLAEVLGTHSRLPYGLASPCVTDQPGQPSSFRVSAPMVVRNTSIPSSAASVSMESCHRVTTRVVSVIETEPGANRLDDGYERGRVCGVAREDLDGDRTTVEDSVRLTSARSRLSNALLQRHGCPSVKNPPRRPDASSGVPGCWSRWMT